MRRVLSVVLGLGVGLGLVLTAEAEARPRDRGEIIVIKREARTKVIVTKRRSFLDAGTEVKPGERKFTDYVYPPNYRPSDVYDPIGNTRFSLPRPWDLPGFPNGSGLSF